MSNGCGGTNENASVDDTPEMRADLDVVIKNDAPRYFWIKASFVLGYRFGTEPDISGA
jgi:hypothetical protein